MKTYMLPYNIASEGAKLLATALGVKRIKRKNSIFNPRKSCVIINWGCSNAPRHTLTQDHIWINLPGSVQHATNKLDTFYWLKQGGVSTVPWTTNKAEALKWMDEGHTVFARTKLESCEGQGIIVYGPEEEVLDDAPLYTKYIKKKHEFRVHVVGGEAIDVVRKVKKLGSENKDTMIRNTANDYVFTRKGEQAHRSVIEQAIAAVKALGLDFGAVDVIWNDYYKKAYVLEVNTAPGIVGMEVKKYKEALEKLVQKLTHQ